MIFRALYLRLALAYYSWLGYPEPFLNHYRILLNLENGLNRAKRRLAFHEVALIYYRDREPFTGDMYWHHCHQWDIANERYSKCIALKKAYMSLDRRLISWDSLLEKL